MHVDASASAIGGALLVGLALSASAADPSSGGVTLHSAVPVIIAPNTKAFSVRYSYAFPKHQAVHINGLGSVPASGDFHYLTSDPTLVVTDSTTGTVLGKVPLAPTVRTAGATPVDEVPQEQAFGSAYRTFRWNSSVSLQQRATGVLSNYFSVEPTETGGTVSIATTYRPINTSNLIGRVALLISFPYDSGPQGFVVHVRTLTEQGRSHTAAFRTPVDNAIVVAGDAFASSVLTEIGLTSP